MRTLIGRIVAISTGLAIVLSTSVAMAGPHDLQLSEFLEFEKDEVEDDRVWGQASGDEEAFDALVKDLGQVVAPRPIAPAETLGQAGFAVQMMGSFSNIQHNAEHWDATEQRPDSALFSSHLQVRKGLPFSFEVVGNLAHLSRSEMFVMGADFRWALHEGYRYFPDVGARGSVNTITGAPELNLVNGSWDISMSKSFGIGGVSQLTPYLGYQQLWTIGSTRVLNAQPQDPRPPQTLSRENARDLTFAPEYVFGQREIRTDRFFGGLRLNTWIMSFTLEAVIGDTVQQYTFSGGVDF